MAEDARDLLRRLIAGDPRTMDLPGAAGTLGLADCWIAAGFIRNRVWDHLHGYSEPTPPTDLDVVYFDPDHPDEAIEKRLEARLRACRPGHRWSVKNQARMAIRNGDAAYRSTAHGLEHWCETPTAVGARLNQAGEVEIIAPLGLDDLFGLIVRPTPSARSSPHRLARYRARMAKKNWPRLWPRIRVLDL